jgi:hypothetical protein
MGTLNAEARESQKRPGVKTGLNFWRNFVEVLMV